MANWEHTVDINSIINDESVDDFKKPGLMADLLEESGLFVDETFIDDLREFDGEESYDAEEVDAILNDLYEYCDAELIWLGI